MAPGDLQRIIAEAWAAGWKPPRKVGRDPEKRRASRLAWEARNPEKVKTSKRAYDKSRAGKPKSLAQRLAKRVRDQRSRIRSGHTPRLHQAHVELWRLVERDASRLHDAHVVSFFSDGARRYAWRYRFDVEFRLRELVRRQVRKKIDSKERFSELIRSALKRSGDSATVVAMLGWSIADLRARLQAQLPDGVSLQSLGAAGYHIDHIIPKRFFNLSTLEGVRAYWALENLRPLPGLENIRKGARLEVDFIV